MAPHNQLLSLDEQRAYERAVEVVLGEKSVRKKLDKRPHASTRAVRDVLSGHAYINRALNSSQGPLGAYRESCFLLQQEQQKYEIAREATRWDPCLVLLACALLGSLLSLALEAYWAAVACATVVAICAALILAKAPARDNVRNLLRASAIVVATGYYAVRASLRLTSWETHLKQSAVNSLALEVIEGLLGDDPESLFLAEQDSGLRDARNPKYLVVGDAEKQLREKLLQMEGGTIAVCGPRGAGKSTLLESCARPQDFHLLALAPAAYAPHEFLLSLFGDVTRKYLVATENAIPDTYSLTREKRGRLFSAIWRALRWAFFASVSASLLALGVAGTALGGVDAHRDYALGEVNDTWADLQAFFFLALDGEEVAARLICVILALAVWKKRGGRSMESLALMRYWGLVAVSVGLWYLFLEAALLQDEGALRVFLPENFGNLLNSSDPLPWWLPLTFLCALAWQARRGDQFRVLGILVTVSQRRVLWSCVSSLIGTLAYLDALSNAPLKKILSQEEIPALLLLAVSASYSWSLRERKATANPKLAQLCRTHLINLRTIQNESATLNVGLPQWTSLGRSTMVTSGPAPFTYPQLVSEFRGIIEKIAEENKRAGLRTIIAIDELDRLGSEQKARDFLGEIKAIFGVSGVHYIVSVSEDVGAAFVRRGLPHRDATDSSLDDVLYVGPRTSSESQVILDERLPDLSLPYVLLAHALSGGVPRDLIRYARRLLEVKKRSASFEMRDLARDLILSELADTLAGFRTLLAKEEWNSDNSPTLHRLHLLIRLLRSSDAVSRAKMRALLEQFAITPVSRNSESGNASPMSFDISSAVDTLLSEAAAYAYFSLTLLDIFGEPGFDRRRTIAAQSGENGDPQLIAEARQELTISPHSARIIMNDVRLAWGLPVWLPNSPS